MLLQSHFEVVFIKTSMTIISTVWQYTLKNLIPLIQDPTQHSFTQRILTECLYCVQVMLGATAK